MGVTVPLEQGYVAGRKRIVREHHTRGGERLPDDLYYQSGCLQRIGYHQQRSPRSLSKMRSFGQTWWAAYGVWVSVSSMV